MKQLDERFPNFRRAEAFRSAAEKPALPFWPPPAAVSSPLLPPIAAKHDDLETIKKAVEDAASVGAPLWLSYLFLLLSIAITAGGVRHADLLLENPVELPFLNIKLPLIAFFVLAPILFVIVHAYVMAHLALLSDKAKRFHEELRRQIDGTNETHKIRDGLRRQLPINIFVQFLAGPLEIREGLFSVLLWAVAWVSLVAGPVLLLLLLHVQFLPYHDSRITWMHRGTLIFELVIIWWLWMKILSGRSKPDALEKTNTGPLAQIWNGFLWWSRNIIAWPLTGLIVLFSVFLATFPGEWEQWPFTLARRLEPIATKATLKIFGDPVNLDGIPLFVANLNPDENTRSWPANTLNLKDFVIYEALKVDDRKMLALKPRTYSLHGRHLEYANLSAAWLGNVDLRGAHLEGATLVRAHLQGASFDRAYLDGASLSFAHLQGATFPFARLQGASLTGANLEGADLGSAQLQGASLGFAHLEGASLEMAELQGASLSYAQLLGASLAIAKTEATDLSHTFLWRAQYIPKTTESLTFGLSWGALGYADFGPNGLQKLEPWNGKQYADLVSRLTTEIPEGEAQSNALMRVRRLDCSKTTVAPCDPNAPPPPIAKELQEQSVTEDEYYKALAKTLRGLVCNNQINAIHVLRGVTEHRPFALGPHDTPAFIDYVTSSACSVSTALSEHDLTRLLQIKKAVARPLTPVP